MTLLLGRGKDSFLPSLDQSIADLFSSLDGVLKYLSPFTASRFCSETSQYSEMSHAPLIDEVVLHDNRQDKIKGAAYMDIKIY